MIAHGSGAFTTYAGRSQLAAVLFVVSGLGLIAAGLVASRRRRLVGVLSVAAGFVWFAPAWQGWEGGPAFLRAAAALVAPLVLSLLVHLVLVVVMVTPSRSAMVVIVTTYAVVGILAAFLVLVRDPYLDPHCFADCTTNLFVVQARPHLARTLTTASLWLTLATTAAFLAVLTVWWCKSPAMHRRQFLVVLGGGLLALTTIAASLLTLHHGFEDPDAARFKAAFLARCVAALLIAGGLVYAVSYTRRIRRAIARTVASDETTHVGSLESALASATNDSTLSVAYWLPAVGCYGDSHGRPVPDPMSHNKSVTTAVVRNGAPVAVITHRSDPFEIERALRPDLRLALDNERLRAEVLAQVRELRESRARVVAAGDERRRQLERNLHDGAQQSLLGLTYDLRRARATAVANGDHDIVELIDHAVKEVGQAFEELRQLAHGIFPAVLSHAGLGAAATSVAEKSPIPVAVACTVSERMTPAVETAAYVVVADGVDAMSGSGATNITVTIDRHEDDVVVELTPDQLERLPDVVHIADRVGAAGGILSCGFGGIRAEIPCAL